jgi:hypothetical protein
MKKILFGLAALTLILPSCKKDDDKNSTTSTRGTLTSGMWKISAVSASFEVPGYGSQTVDGFKSFPACQQDNLYKFNEDGTTTTDEGATKCSSSSPQQSTSGTWSLSSDETKLTVSGTSGTGSVQSVAADIVTINSSTLVIKYVTNVNGISTSTTTTYAHQ